MTSNKNSNDLIHETSTQNDKENITFKLNSDLSRDDECDCDQNSNENNDNSFDDDINHVDINNYDTNHTLDSSKNTIDTNADFHMKHPFYPNDADHIENGYRHYLAYNLKHHMINRTQHEQKMENDTKKSISDKQISEEYQIKEVDSKKREYRKQRLHNLYNQNLKKCINNETEYTSKNSKNFEKEIDDSKKKDHYQTHHMKSLPVSEVTDDKHDEKITLTAAILNDELKRSVRCSSSKLKVRDGHSEIEDGKKTAARPQSIHREHIDANKNQYQTHHTRSLPVREVMDEKHNEKITLTAAISNDKLQRSVRRSSSKLKVREGDSEIEDGKKTAARPQSIHREHIDANKDQHQTHHTRSLPVREVMDEKHNEKITLTAAISNDKPQRSVRRSNSKLKVKEGDSEIEDGKKTANRPQSVHREHIDANKDQYQTHHTRSLPVIEVMDEKHNEKITLTAAISNDELQGIERRSKNEKLSKIKSNTQNVIYEKLKEIKRDQVCKPVDIQHKVFSCPITGNVTNSRRPTVIDCSLFQLFPNIEFSMVDNVDKINENSISNS